LIAVEEFISSAAFTGEPSEKAAVNAGSNQIVRPQVAINRLYC
jgi:hypothetical protein